MPISHRGFLEEIEQYKKLHGFLTYDDDYRRRFWLPYLPVDQLKVHQRQLREKWRQNSDTIPRHDKFLKEAYEKPTRIVDKGFLLSVGNPIPRYINRGSAVAKEFQGARIGRDFKIPPEFPVHILPRTANYLIRRNSLLHRDCLDVAKNSATLWRDIINIDLGNKIISGVPCWYHPLVSSARSRFNQRWPNERKQKYPDLYFHEFCKLFHTPSRIFVLDWIDEQQVFPHEDYRKKY